MNRITKFLVASALAVGFAAAGFASASGSAPDPSGGDRSNHPVAAPISPQIVAAGVIPQSGFVSIVPCRAADTRLANAGALAANTVRDFSIAGNLGFESQGGRPGGCGLPAGAKAAVLSLTSTKTAGDAYLTGWPSGSPMPKSTALSEHKNLTLTAESTLQLGNSGKVSMKSSLAATDLIIDIVGYYREPIAGTVDYQGNLLYGSDAVKSITHLSTGWYRINLNQNVYACSGQAVANGSGVNMSVNMEATSVLVITRDLAAQNTPYLDQGFTFTVTC